MVTFLLNVCFTSHNYNLLLWRKSVSSEWESQPCPSGLHLVGTFLSTLYKMPFPDCASLLFSVLTATGSCLWRLHERGASFSFPTAGSPVSLVSTH